MRYPIANLGQPDPNTAIADAICKILKAASEPSTPEESQLYQNEFNKWYGKVSGTDWMEDGVTERVGKFCPELVKLYNRLRADFLSNEQANIVNRRRPKLTPPPVGPNIPSVDEGGPRGRPAQPVPTPTATPTSTSTPRSTSQAPIPVSNPNQFPDVQTPGYLTQQENSYRNTDLANQIENYWSALRDYGNRPATPTIYEQTYTPQEVEERTSPRSQERQDVASVDRCPPDAQGNKQFWDGRQCRGSVGSVPSIPGGLMPSGATSAASLTTMAPAASYGNYAGMSGVRLGQENDVAAVHLLRAQLKACIQATEANPPTKKEAECVEINKKLTEAASNINKKKGIQNPGFLPQVSMQDQYSEQYPSAYPGQYQTQETSRMEPAPQYSWNQQLPDPAQDYGQQSAVPLQVARNYGLDPMAQNSWNQAMDTSGGQSAEPTPEVARRAGLDPNQQYSWNQTVRPDEEEEEESTLPLRVARNSGLDPMAQNTWNQYASMSGRIPLEGGIGMRALMGAGNATGLSGSSMGQGGMQYARDQQLVDAHKAYKESLQSGDVETIDKAYSEYRAASEAREAEMPLRDEMERLREQNREDSTDRSKDKAIQDRIAEMEEKWPGWDKSRSYWEEFSRTGVNPNYPEWYKTAGKAAEKALELALQAAPLIPLARGVRPSVPTPGGRSPVATPRTTSQRPSSAKPPPVRPPVATPSGKSGPPPGYFKATPEEEAAIAASGKKAMMYFDKETGQHYYHNNMLDVIGSKRLEFPPVATPSGRSGASPTPATMPTKPITPEGPLMGPPVPTGMPAGYGPQPKSVPMPPSMPTWYDPQTGQPYSPIPNMQDYIRRAHEFDVPFPASGRRNMPPGKPFSKGEGEPEREAVASVDPNAPCPTGYYRATEGGPCRDSTGGYANIPSIPGGLMPSGATSAASLTTTAAPASYGNYAGMSGRRSYRIVNR